MQKYIIKMSFTIIKGEKVHLSAFSPFISLSNIVLKLKVLCGNF